MESKPLVTGNGNNVELAYSVFQQGAGAITANGAINSTVNNCANQGLDISADLNGTQHFQGPANMDDNDNFYFRDGDGTTYTWSGGTYWAGNFAWSGGTFWAGSFAWSGGTFWAGNYLWSDGTFWAGSIVWNEATMAVNQWVAQE